MPALHLTTQGTFRRMYHRRCFFRISRFWRTSLGLCTLLGAVAAFAEQANIAVAANFSAPMRAIAEEFEQSSGHRLQVIFGSSGKLYAQVQNGAPFDVLLSADTAKPAALISAGSGIADSRFTYAIGTLALWTTTLSGDPRQQLQAGHFSKLAIANPRLAPYGSAAMETLQQLGLSNALKGKLVMGENIAQTYQFVQSGNAELGFVALSQVIAEGKPPAGVWVVPDSMHAPIRQDAVLLQRGRSNSAAIALLEFLHSEAAEAIIRRYGYGAGDHQTGPVESGAAESQ